MHAGKEMLNWSLNNYIGLANDPEVRKADQIEQLYIIKKDVYILFLG